MNNGLNPILCFRKQLKKSMVSNSKRKKVNLKSISTLITETRESIDTSENS